MLYEKHPKTSHLMEKKPPKTQHERRQEVISVFWLSPLLIVQDYSMRRCLGGDHKKPRPRVTAGGAR